MFSEVAASANTTYTAGTGSSTTGDTYSFGSTASTERAFGGLQSGSLIPTVGAAFTNNTGQTIGSLLIAYTGEQWRLGAVGRVDRLDFQISTDATSLTTGTWIDVDTLDFTAPVTAGSTGALDGNAAANRTAINNTISSISVANGAAFWIRWNDFNATGADDGLAVDDFCITPGLAPTPTPTPTPTATPTPTPTQTPTPTPTPGPVSLTTIGAPVCENFDTLASTGTSSATPAGWMFSEAGSAANATYTAGIGTSTTGDTYSFGSTGSTERSFGGLQSGSLSPTVGAAFTNNTGQTIGSLAVAYTGEQWRLGALGRVDRLDFQFSTDATSLTTGTWSDVNTLDFTAPVTAGSTGALDGNAAANRTAINGTINLISIANGATFWIRWNDFDATGADDGLGVDDFCLTPSLAPAPTPTPTPTPTPIPTPTPTPIADLAITKTDGVSTAAAGSKVTYTIIAVNNGPNVAVGAAVTDTFPAVVANVAWTCTGANGGSCSPSGTGNISQPVTLPVGGSVTFLAAATIAPTATGTITNTATVTPPAGTTDPNPANNTATDTDTLTAPSVFVIDDVSINEGQSGTTAFNFTVSKQGGTGFATSVSYITVDGTATVVNSDYLAQSGTLSFGPLETSKTITVIVNGDTAIEPNETFTVHFLGAVNALIGDSDGTGTIVNDDIPPTTPTPTPTPAPTAGTVNLTVIGVPVCETFDMLANTGTSSVTPAGWMFSEADTGANTTYTAGTGSSTSGDTYSFGSTGSAERAFGGLQSGSLIPTVGGVFTNNTGQTIGSLAVAYTGEQWRLGAAGRVDRLDFQISTNATSLTTGTWTDVDTLDFTAPVTSGSTGALDGNAVANRTSISSTINSINIANGATFWIRWNDFNATGSDDGLSVDDFCITPGLAATSTPTPTPTPRPTPFPEIDLSISQSDSPDPVGVGQPLTYTLTVTITPSGPNQGAVPQVRFSFPSGVPVVFNSASGTNGFTATTDATGVTFAGGLIIPNGASPGTATLSVVVIPQSTGTITSAGTNVVVDPNNLVSETNENNNSAQTIVTTVVAAPTTYDGDINRTAVNVPGTGDGDVNVGDQLQYQRFLAGTDCPAQGTVNPNLNEQQRLDAGPRNTLGDGTLGSADGTAIDAYARHDAMTDFDPNTAGWQPTPAGGPAAITNLGCTAAPEGDGGSGKAGTEAAAVAAAPAAAAGLEVHHPAARRPHRRPRCRYARRRLGAQPPAPPPAPRRQFPAPA